MTPEERAQQLYRKAKFLNGFNQGFGGPSDDSIERNFKEFEAMFKSALEEAKREAFFEAAKIAEDTNYKHKPELMSGEIWLRDTIAEKLRAKAGE